MPFFIDSYSFGILKIGDKIFTNDLVILPEKIIPNWWRAKGHQLSLEDLSCLGDTPLDCLIIGSGYSGVLKVPEEVKIAIEKKGLKILVTKSAAAVQKYNELAQNFRVALAIHLTC